MPKPMYSHEQLMTPERPRPQVEPPAPQEPLARETTELLRALWAIERQLDETNGHLRNLSINAWIIALMPFFIVIAFMAFMAWMGFV